MTRLWLLIDRDGLVVDESLCYTRRAALSVGEDKFDSRDEYRAVCLVERRPVARRKGKP